MQSGVPLHAMRPWGARGYPLPRYRDLTNASEQACGKIPRVRGIKLVLNQSKYLSSETRCVRKIALLMRRCNSICEHMAMRYNISLSYLLFKKEKLHMYEIWHHSTL